MILRYLVKHLIQADAQSEENKMKLHNLATVFAPNLLTMQQVEDTALINGLYFLNYYIFHSTHGIK